jgi:photosystem II stability/assembly factor-like uncharacterized protein
MKRNFLLFILIGIIALYSNEVFAQWTMSVLPNPPGVHGALPGRVNTLYSDGSNIYAGTLGGNLYFSSDNGSNWAYIDTGLTTSDITAIIMYNNTLFVGAYGSGVFSSTDNGKSWKSSDPSLTNLNVYSFAVIDTNLFVGTFGGGVFQSNNNGETWSEVNYGLANKNVRTLGVKDTRLYAGTWGGGVYLSDDMGASWTQSNKGINKLFIYSVAADGSNVYLGNDDGVYISLDGGFSWNLENNGLTNTYIRALIIIHPNLIVATSGQGVFASMNTGGLWTPADSGLTDGYTYCLAVNGSTLFAGALDGEIWRRPLSEVVTGIMEKYKGNIVKNFKLDQNYPNPFNPSTTISYQIPQNEFVTLKVYDITGRVIQTLVNENKSAGKYDIKFEGNNLSSGIYLFRLKAGEYTSIKKMILMK